MADGDLESGLVGESLELGLPEAGAIAVGAAAVGGDRQRCRGRVARPAEVLPPGADARDRELSGVVVDPDRDPAGVVGEVVDAVGDRLAELRVLEVVDAHRDRRALRAKLSAHRLEVPDQLLLLGVDGDHRPAGGERRAHGLADLAKLRIAIGMLGALARLSVGLQAVAQLLQGLQHRAVGDLVPRLAQPAGELRAALRAPPQRPLGIAAHVRIDEPLEIADQGRVLLGQPLAAPARAAHPARLERLTGVELCKPTPDGRLRNRRRAHHRGDPATPMRARLRRSPAPPATLAESALHHPPPLSNRTLIDLSHTESFDSTPDKPTPSRPKPLSCLRVIP